MDRSTIGNSIELSNPRTENRNMVKNNSNKDLNAPIPPETFEAWEIITDFLYEKDMTYTGGCKAFYTGREAEEFHGFELSGAALVVHYDGGDLGYCFNRDWDVPTLVDELESRLEKAGFYVEPINNWSSAIYKA